MGREIRPEAQGDNPVRARRWGGKRGPARWRSRLGSGDRTSWAASDERGAASGEGLDHEVIGPGGVFLEEDGALDEVGHGAFLQEAGNGVADFLHDGAEGAEAFIGAVALLIELLADAAHRGEGPFEVTDDVGEPDLGGGPCEAIAAGDAAAAFDEAAVAEGIEDLLEEALGDVLFLGDLLDADDSRAVMQAQVGEGTQGVFATDGELHGWRG